MLRKLLLLLLVSVAVTATHSWDSCSGFLPCSMLRDAVHRVDSLWRQLERDSFRREADVRERFQLLHNLPLHR